MKNDIVILVHTDYPWKEGLTYRVDNMAKYLSKEYNVTVACPILESSYLAGSEKGIYQIHRFDLRILQKLGANRVLYRMLFTVLFTLCMVKLRKHLCGKQISLVQSEQQLTLIPGTVLSYLFRTKLIVDDILSRSNYYREHLGFFEIIVHAIETIFLRKCSLIISSNSRVAAEIQNWIHSANSKFSVVPNGVQCPRPFSPEELVNPKSKDVIFVGSMYSEQNRRAVQNLLNIFPSVLVKVKQARLIIIGGPKDLLEQSLRVSYERSFEKNMLILGYLSEGEKEKYLLGASVCALPFNSEDSLIGGIRLKALDFMSYGKVVVSTPTGIEGIEGALSGRNVIVADDLGVFTDYLIDVLRNPEKYKSVGKNASVLAGKYQWVNILGEYLSIIRSLTAKPVI
jgi:glycosyltransferase involved in cell wall biosynthesis